MSIWIVIILAGIYTFLIRYSFIALVDRIDLPVWLSSSLKYVPPSVLMVIAVQSLVYPDGTFDISLGNVRLLAGIIAALVAWKTRSVMITILIGMAVLVGLQYFIH